MSDEKLREAFESWASGPPHELSVERVPNDPDKHDWPGSYRLVEVDLCWQAWKACAEKCEVEDDQPITAEWLKEQGWVCNDDRGHCRHPTIVNLWFVGWYNPGDQQEIVWDAYFNDDILRFKGVRNRSDLLTLIRLIEGGEQ